MTDPTGRSEMIGKPVVGILSGISSFGLVMQKTSEKDNKMLFESPDKYSQVDLKKAQSPNDEEKPSARLSTPREEGSGRPAIDPQALRRSTLRNLRSIEDMGQRSNLVMADAGVGNHI